MNTPSPLQPMGRLPEGSSARSGLNIAVIGIVALHVIFFGGLLLQGCSKRTPQGADSGLGQPTGFGQTQVTNTPATDPYAGYAQPYGTPTNLAGHTPPSDSLSFTSAPPSEIANTWTVPATNTPATEPVVETVVAMKEYSIAKGDTPAAIAKKHGITLDQLREANPDMDDRRLQIGQKLQIPPAPPKDTAVAGATTTPDAAGTAADQVYVVKAGDNLTKIAAKHGVSLKELRAYNNLKTDRITVNQKLKIPPAPARPPATTPAPGA